MIILKNMKELVYNLDGKYYIVGRCECKECKEKSIIELYNRFVELTSDEDFKFFNAREMPICVRDEVVDVYNKICTACYVSIEKSEMTEEKLLLRDTLEKTYRDEIERQYDIWIKADTCLNHKKLHL